MTNKWWKAEQYLLMGSLLMFATVAAGGQLAQLADGTTGPVTLDSGYSVVFHFDDELTDAQNDAIRIVISSSTTVDSVRIAVGVDGQNQETIWHGVLTDSVDPYYTCVSQIGTDAAGNVDFGVWYLLASESDGGLEWASVKYVKIENPTDSAIVISRVEGSPFTEVQLTPAQMIGALAVKVAAINNAQGIVNSLDAKLDAALAALDNIRANDYIAAINKLEAFVSEVNAQAGNKISVTQADQLINGVHNATDPTNNFAGAQDIIDALTGA